MLAVRKQLFDGDAHILEIVLETSGFKIRSGKVFVVLRLDVDLLFVICG